MALGDRSSNSHHVYLVRPGEGEEGGRRRILRAMFVDQNWSNLPMQFSTNYGLFFIEFSTNFGCIFCRGAGCIRLLR